MGNLTRRLYALLGIASYQELRAVQQAVGDLQARLPVGRPTRPVKEAKKRADLSVRVRDEDGGLPTRRLDTAVQRTPGLHWKVYARQLRDRPQASVRHAVTDLVRAGHLAETREGYLWPYGVSGAAGCSRSQPKVTKAAVSKTRWRFTDLVVGSEKRNALVDEKLLQILALALRGLSSGEVRARMKGVGSNDVSRALARLSSVGVLLKRLHGGRTLWEMRRGD